MEGAKEDIITASSLYLQDPTIISFEFESHCKALSGGERFPILLVTLFYCLPLDLLKFG